MQSAPHLVLDRSVSKCALQDRVNAFTVHYMHSYMTKRMTLAGIISSPGNLGTYFPPFTGSIPKLDPTIPIQVQFSSAAFVHLAVAVAPTLRHVIDADAGDSTRNARVTVKRANMIIAELGSAYDVWKKATTIAIFIYFICCICQDTSPPPWAPVGNSSLGMSWSLGLGHGG